MQKIIVNTDGGARGNPGPAGIGVIVRDETGKVLLKSSKFLGIQTNNFAEYEAVFYGLSEVKRLLGDETSTTYIEVRLDSELIERQLIGKYKVKEPGLKVQYAKVRELIDTYFPNIVFLHVPRAENKDADFLANEAMDQGTR